MKIYLHISFFGIKTCCNNTVQIPAKFLGCTLLGTISIHNVLPSEQKELVKMEKKIHNVEVEEEKLLLYMNFQDFKRVMNYLFFTSLTICYVAIYRQLYKEKTRV